jgi:hypothetical protein
MFSYQPAQQVPKESVNHCLSFFKADDKILVYMPEKSPMSQIKQRSGSIE